MFFSTFLAFCLAASLVVAAPRPQMDDTPYPRDIARHRYVMIPYVLTSTGIMSHIYTAGDVVVISLLLAKLPLSVNFKLNGCQQSRRMQLQQSTYIFMSYMPTRPSKVAMSRKRNISFILHPPLLTPRPEIRRLKLRSKYLTKTTRALVSVGIL